jgi:hypothetical protein
LKHQILYCYILGYDTIYPDDRVSIFLRNDGVGDTYCHKPDGHNMRLQLRDKFKTYVPDIASDCHRFDWGVHIAPAWNVILKITLHYIILHVDIPSHRGTSLVHVKKVPEALTAATTDKHYLLRCDAVQSARNPPTYRRITLPPSSGPKLHG